MTDNGFQETKGVSDLKGKMRFRAISGGNAPGGLLGGFLKGADKTVNRPRRPVFLLHSVRRKAWMGGKVLSSLILKLYPPALPSP
jgi:hypothetical protein